MTTPEGVDLERLREYFTDHVPDATGAPLSAELIAGGRSNLTYRITDGGHTWVLRRPPLAHVLPTAHDMAREYRVLRALADTEVPVPRTLALCEDRDVNGAPFYVMELVDGVILRTADELATLSPDQAAACSRQLIDVLARLHSIDFDVIGLGDFGHPDGFLERNVRRWGEQWQRSKTRELSGVDELARRLTAAMPESGPPAIVHGDYRLDNTMLAPDDPGRIVAVLDWEMSTLGDPLTDVGLFLLYWGYRDGGAVASPWAVTGGSGFLSRDEIIARYAQQSGRTIDTLDFYVVLASYKLAVILEGINARFQMGKTLGEGFDTIGEMVTGLVDAALDIANQSSIAALHG